MKCRLIVTLLLVCFSSSLFAQLEMLESAFEDFATSRFWQYEEVPITWTMKGTIQADLNEGLNNLTEENPQLAEGNFSDVLSKDSTLWQAYYYRAAARKQLKKLPLAEEDLQHALKLHPDFYEGHVELAKVYHLRRRLDESERELKRAFQIDKTKATAYYLKGDIDLQQHQVRNAVHNYEECLQYDSHFHDARIKLALIEFTAKKDKDDALQHLNQVLAYDSLQKSALLFRAILSPDKAQNARDLTNLILVSPNNLIAHFLRGMISTETGDFERAFLDFQKIIKDTSTDDNNFKGQQTWVDKKIDLQNVGAYTLTRIYGLPEADAAKLKQAYCQILTDEFEKSIAAINQTSNPNEEPLATYLKAVANEHKGDHNTAFQYYDLTLRLDPEIADAHKKMGIYYQELKQWDKSVQSFTQVLKIYPDNFVICKIRGTSYFYLGRYKESIADYNTYLSHDTANTEIIGYRGMAYFKNGDRLKAYIDFAESDNDNAIDFPDLTHLVDSVMSRSDTTKSMELLTSLTKECPYFTEGFVRKYKIHVHRNEWKAIEKTITDAVRKIRLDASKSDQAYLLTLQGMNFARHHHDQDAINILTEAVKLDNKSDLAYLERGKVLLSQGKTSKAEGDLRQASELGNKEASQLLANGLKK